MSSLEKQQEKLNKLNEQIKAQKEKIDKKLGHDIIKKAGIDYSELNKNELNILSDKISEFILKELSEKVDTDTEQVDTDTEKNDDTDTEKNDDTTIANSDKSDLDNHNEY